ncbi:MAG: type II toxin-antitoxin system death-on-curing family toxin [Flavobacterium sp. BFFFF1]|uniref:type II toxin-antitoxin system death-on-curing family toxin n=1 Tax=Flavobacterium sp. BFFFF1 TaxID=2015557 RepID=UPI000BDB4BB2|nr:type II toxin-antitoxin system death-on-curing family toxin [Flavobacterium sp. BFFFF1]OYU78884.1 MAG: type II toxin-antitoxin system death-on-curing family toxin [Flavobacterium sp. BFFFF1]
MISEKEVEIIHNILIDKFGGSKGIRDSGALQSSLARPFATFDQQDLYTNAVDKASAIFESIIINHPFVDGNKRTAYTLMRLILLDYGMDISATQDEKYSFVISASKGEYRFEEIRNWITNHLQN